MLMTMIECVPAVRDVPTLCGILYIAYREVIFNYEYGPEIELEGDGDGDGPLGETDGFCSARDLLRWMDN